MFKLIILVYAYGNVVQVGPIGNYLTAANCYADVNRYIANVVRAARNNGVWIDEIKYKCGKIGDLR